MTNADRPLRMAHSLDVIRPADEQALALPMSDWEHLRTCVSRIGPGGNGYLALGTLMLGVAGSALVVALTLPAEAARAATDFGMTVQAAAVASFLVCLVSGTVICYFAWQQRQASNQTKTYALEEMERLRSRYQVTPVSGAAPLATPSPRLRSFLFDWLYRAVGHREYVPLSELVGLAAQEPEQWTAADVQRELVHMEVDGLVIQSQKGGSDNPVSLTGAAAAIGPAAQTAILRRG